MRAIIGNINKYIHYGGVFKIPRRIFKHLMSMVYPIVVRIWKIPPIETIENTILKLKKERCSIARFGDSEVLYIVDKLNLPYQIYDVKLASKLEVILKAETPNLIVGLPDGYRALEEFDPPIQTFWRSQISYTYPRFQKYLNLNAQYWNANITRLYYGYIDKSKSSKHFELIRSLWMGRDVLLIEGEKSRLGAGNDLFENAKSVSRILGPAHHAFSKSLNLKP
jgi:glycosyltransferase family protein